MLAANLNQSHVGAIARIPSVIKLIQGVITEIKSNADFVDVYLNEEKYHLWPDDDILINAREIPIKYLTSEELGKKIWVEKLKNEFTLLGIECNQTRATLLCEENIRLAFSPKETIIIEEF